jgi:hypothetical protein
VEILTRNETDSQDSRNWGAKLKKFANHCRVKVGFSRLTRRQWRSTAKVNAAANAATIACQGFRLTTND